MRAFVLTLMLAALSACDAGSAAQDAVRVSGPAMLTGPCKPASDTARQLTGGVDIERAGLLFDNGAVLYTRALQPRRGGDVVARGGDSYAALAVRPAELTVELRRVTQQVSPTGVAGLCGAETPQYVALAYDERATTVTVLVFAGDEAPGPDATRSWLCAALAFVAPTGARTRQGVVLY